MAHQVIWTEDVINEFVTKALLTKEEETIIRMRAHNKSIVQQAMALNVGESTINTMTRRLKRKYDEVQPYSNILKPRKSKIEEIYN